MDYVTSGLSRGHARSLNHNRQPSATSTTLFPTSLHVQPNVLLPNTIRTINSSWCTFLMRELVFNEWRRPIISWPSFELMLSSMALSTSSLLSLHFSHVCYSSHYAFIPFPGICVEIERVIISEVSRLKKKMHHVMHALSSMSWQWHGDVLDRESYEVWVDRWLVWYFF